MSEDKVKVPTEQAVQQIADSLSAINECIINLGERVKAIEDYVQELSPANKIFYKPKGSEEYLNLSDNFNQIYKRLGELEDGV